MSDGSSPKMPTPAEVASAALRSKAADLYAKAERAPWSPEHRNTILKEAQVSESQAQLAAMGIGAE